MGILSCSLGATEAVPRRFTWLVMLWKGSNGLTSEAWAVVAKMRQKLYLGGDKTIRCFREGNSNMKDWLDCNCRISPITGLFLSTANALAKAALSDAIILCCKSTK